MSAITIDQVVAKYVETRAELDKLKKEYEEKIAPLKDFQDKREQWMLGQLAANGCQNMKTQHGTVYQMVKESVTCADWDTLLAHIQETEGWNLLNHAINKTAALELMGEERQNPPPPGVNYVALRTVGVRKA